MSDELNPCKHCGGEARFQIFDTTCNVECRECGIGTRNVLLDNYQECVDKWNRSADDAQIAANDNLPAETDISDNRVDDNDGNAAQGLRDLFGIWKPDESADCGTAEDGASQVPQSDSRERLEADIAASDYSFAHTPAGFRDIKSWLDRQAAITAEETSNAWEEYRDATQREIDELTAKCDLLDQAYTAVGEACTDAETECECLQDKVDELTAERDQLQEQHGRQVKSIERLTAERDEAIEIRDQACGDAATFKAERDGLKRQLENQAAYIAGVEDGLCRCESQLVRDGKDIDRLTAERDYLKAELETYRKYADQGECENSQSEENGDTREKLEADALKLQGQIWRAGYEHRDSDSHRHFIELFDRQAAITKRETSEAYERQAERQGNLVLMLHNKLTDTQQQVDELTADAKRWADAANAQRLVAIDQADKVQELTAERDELRKQLAEKQRVCDIQRESFRKIEADCKRLANENECFRKHGTPF